MKKLFLSMILIALPLVVSAYDCQVDGIYYNLNKTNKTAEVTCLEGDNYHGKYISDYYGSVTIPEKFTDEGVEYIVTSIGNFAFYKCSNLTFVTISNSVTSIGEDAFYGCSSLTSVNIPNSVTSIGRYAFSHCSGLFSISIGNSVTNIGSNAFYACNGLTSVHLTDLAAWCKVDFNNLDSNPLYYAHHLYIDNAEVLNLVIPEGVSIIKGYAFYNCSSLTSVTIPSSVTSIGWSTFSNCTNLTSVTIPNTVNYIGSHAFSGCSSLNDVTIPNSITAIYVGTFSLCSSLTSITIPSSVKSIGDDFYGAFYGCTGLTSVISEMEDPCFIVSDCFPEDVFNNATLYVPKGTVDKYKSTNYWSKFAFIEETETASIKTTNRENGETAEEQVHYDASGSQINKSHRGLNIIRMSDGTVKKVVVK